MFTFDNWAAHRSQKRYQRHILQLFQVWLKVCSIKNLQHLEFGVLVRRLTPRRVVQSRIVRGLLLPLGGLTALGSGVAVYEQLREVGMMMLRTSTYFRVLFCS